MDACSADHAGTALAVLRIIGINIVLSGDNAVVIALACRALPPAPARSSASSSAPAPRSILRIIFTVLVQYLLDLPWLKLVGGLLLLWIAVKLLMAEEADEDSVKAAPTLLEAVKIVAIADIVMSLDNVLAIAAAAEAATCIWLIILGLLISHSAGRLRRDADRGLLIALSDPGLGRRGAAGLDCGRADGQRPGHPAADAGMEPGLGGSRGRQLDRDQGAASWCSTSAAVAGVLIVLLAGRLLQKPRHTESSRGPAE